MHEELKEQVHYSPTASSGRYILMFLVVSGGHIRTVNCGEGSPESSPVSRNLRCTSCRTAPLGCSSPAIALCPDWQLKIPTC